MLMLEESGEGSRKLAQDRLNRQRVNRQVRNFIRIPRAILRANRCHAGFPTPTPLAAVVKSIFPVGNLVGIL